MEFARQLLLAKGRVDLAVANAMHQLLGHTTLAARHEVVFVDGGAGDQWAAA
jgi:hypothetical protein